ncbi:MAG TPA: ion transporter [Rhizobiaceae bacterium]|nr:ion transporter [Rhizobiaceae bacterium]
MRQNLTQFLESDRFQKAIIALIIVNAVILGLETSKTVMGAIGPFLIAVDHFILAVFVVEIALRIFAYGWRFFLRPWSVFDFVVVAIALMPAGGAFGALRALRVLRVLRLISAVPEMRRVIEGLLKAVPGIASVAALMALLFYVFAVIGTKLYGETFPDWFGTLGATMYTLFQIMTLESWSMGIVRPVMEAHPTAWAFFVTYILVTTFTVLNLFIAVIVNAMHSGADETAHAERDAMKAEIIAEMRAMEERLLKEVKGRG